MIDLDNSADAAFWSPAPLDYDREDYVWVSADGGTWCGAHKPSGTEVLDVPAYDLESRKTLVRCTTCGRRLA